MPLVLLGVERWRRTRRTRTLVLSAAGALVVCWLQPWQGGTLALIVLAAKGFAGGARASGPRSGLAVPAAVALPGVYYFALPSSTRPGSSPPSPTPRAPGDLDVAVVGDRAEHRSAGAARGPRLQDARARLAVRRRARLAVCRAARLPAAHGHVPVSLVPGARDPALDTGGPGRAERLAAPAAGARPGRSGADDRAGHGAQGRGGGEQRAGGGRSVLRVRRRAARARRARGRPAARRRAGARVRRAHAAVQDRARGLRGRPLVDAGLGAARGGDARAVRDGLSPEQARALVRRSGARFLFVDCRPGLRDLRSELRPLLEEVRRFGCATVYVLHPHAGTAVLPR